VQVSDRRRFLFLEGCTFLAYQHKLIRDHILESLREAILTGELKPGERIVELEMAGRFQSSQGPVREALQRLAEEGLVESRRHRGTFVSALSYGEMGEIFAVRRTVEEMSARRAAMEMSSEQLANARALVSSMHEAAAANDFLKLVDADMAFHRYICECASQPVLLRVWNILTNHIRRFVTLSHPKYFPDLEELAATHDPLLESLEQRDPIRAGELFVEHIDLIWERIQALESAEAHQTESDELQSEDL